MYDTGVYGMGFDPYSETGWFGSKLVKRVGKIAKGAVKAVGQGAKFVGTQALPAALPYIQQGMKALGPVGMVASGAAGALAAVAKGQSLENIAWAAAEGASPPGIDRALMAAKALAKGTPVLNVAINAARGSIAPGPAQRAFDIGVATVKSGSKGALASARNQLRSVTEKAAFDSAVGTVAKAASGVTKLPSMAPRLPMPRFRAPGYSPNRQMTNVALNTLRRNPSLNKLPIREIAHRTGLSFARIREAKGLIEVGMVYGDTGAAESVLPYKLKSGDIPYQLAQKFTGNANRWREIPGVNKVGMANYKGGKDMVVKNVTTTDPKTKKKTTTTLLDPFYSGLEINLPGDWNVPGAKPVIVGGTSPGTGPTPVPYPIPTAPPPMGPPATVPTSTSPIPFPTPPISNGNIPMPGPIPGLPIPTSDKPPSTPIPMPGPVPIPGTTSPVPMPGPTLPTEIPKPPLTAEQKKKKDATAAAAGLAIAGLLFFA